MSIWSTAAAERAFASVARARRRAVLACRVGLRRTCGCLTLAVHDRPRTHGDRPQARGLQDVALDAIVGTLEPGRARHFDPLFRPAPSARERWQRIWLAEERGVVLPPVRLVPVGDGFAVRDGHHRVSVARARGACRITALVDAA